jgi:DNA-binding LacI/PurR family transcriptional regulator
MHPPSLADTPVPADKSTNGRLTFVRIAEVAGVSTATVARAINHRALLSAETAKRVDDAMISLGYCTTMRSKRGRPRKQVASRGTHNLGLVLSGFAGRSLRDYPLFPEVLMGIEGACAECDRSLFVGNLSKEGALPRFYLEGRVEGLLLLGWFTGSEPFYRYLGDFPCVSLMTHTYSFGDHVLPDNLKAGELAAEYLVGCGVDELVFFNARPHHASFAEMMSAFLARTRSCIGPALSYVGEMIEPAAVGFESLAAMSAVRELARRFAVDCRPHKRYGVFVPDAQQLPPLYEALRGCGISPEDNFQFVAVDNSPRQVLSTLQPQPALINLRPEEIGRCGARQLMARIGEGAAETRRRMLVTPRLVPPAGSPALVEPSESFNVPDAESRR